MRPNEAPYTGRSSAISLLVVYTWIVAIKNVLSKLGLRDVAPVTLAWVPIVIGALALCAYTFFIRKQRIPEAPGASFWTYVVVIGVLRFAVTPVTGMFALQRLPAITATYLSTFAGVGVILVGILGLKESPGPYQVVGTLLAMLGLRAFFGDLPSSYEVVGVLLVAVGVVADVLAIVATRKLILMTDFSINNDIFSSLTILAGCLVLAPIGVALDWPPRVSGFDQWAILLYVGLVATAIAVSMWNYLLRIMRAYEASVLSSSSVIWTALLAVVVLKEDLSLRQIISIGLVLTGLSLMQLRARWAHEANRD